MSDHTKEFETARTRQLRATNLDPSDERTISQIEEFGCSVISVGRECRDDLNWTYTIGVFDTSGKPDLISVGLPFKTAHACLNHAVKLQRGGVDLTKGRYPDLIGNVDCQFRPVAPKWVKHLMNWANWYYGRTDYPVLQAVFPDLENRFPEDAGFNRRFAQPLLQPGRPFTEIERGFWNSIDRSSEFSDWKFPDPPHTAAFVSKSVHEGREPVTFVSHDLSDGAWQFLGDSIADGERPIIACLHQPIKNDPSLFELSDLPRGWQARRNSPDEAWERYESEPEEAES